MAKLSEDRAEQISQLVDDGHADRNIAAILGMQESSVRRYIRHIRHGRGPRILLFDIETSPMSVLVWGLYKQRISPDNIIKEWAVLSWAAKWLFDSSVMSDVVTPQEAKERTDKSVIESIWALLEEADIIIAHNAKNFDVRKLNARFSANDLLPPKPYQVIDTLKISRQVFAFSSHKLDHLTKMLGVRGKIPTDFGLWKRCIGLTADVEGQEKALKEMEVYNKSDVFALEDLYLELRPWTRGHPNVGLYYDGTKERCGNCGSVNIEWGGFYYTPAGRYKSYRCTSCGSPGRDRYSDLKKDERKNLTTSTAR